jgi:hypothetical protein
VEKPGPSPKKKAQPDTVIPVGRMNTQQRCREDSKPVKSPPSPKAKTNTTNLFWIVVSGTF